MTGKLFYIVFGLAIVLRLALCILNREANDDHMEVIRLITANGTVPASSDCAECFQPKTFYLISAGILMTTGISDPDMQIVIIQLLNFLFGIIILIYLWKFLGLFAFDKTIRMLAYALVALNPRLIAINSQVTNDTLLILCGVVVIYSCTLCFRSFQLKYGIAMIAAIILASIVKGSGIVLAIAFGLIITIKILYDDASYRKSYLLVSFVFFLLFASIVPFAGGYYRSYIEYGTPFSTGMGPNANVKSEEVFRYRPGVLSTGSAIMTFRLASLLEQPYITDDPDVYPKHRTSLWSQLYGRLFFLHFDQHPPSWKNTNPVLLNIGRAALLLALIPSALLLLGVGQFFYQIKSRYGLNLQRYIRDGNWIHLVFSGGFLMFIVKYSRAYPDFSTMKVIFLFPALLSFIYFFMLGYSVIKSQTTRTIMTIVIIILVMLNVTDVVWLIGQLK